MKKLILVILLLSVVFGMNANIFTEKRHLVEAKCHKAFYLIAERTFVVLASFDYRGETYYKYVVFQIKDSSERDAVCEGKYRVVLKMTIIRKTGQIREIIETLKIDLAPGFENEKPLIVADYEMLKNLSTDGVI